MRLRNGASVMGWVLIAAGIAAGVAAAPVRGAEPAGPPPVTKLKPLFVETAVVTDGQAQASVVAPASGCYDAAARRIVQAVQSLTGVTLPVVDGKSPEAAIPLRGNVIVLGNRSTNRMIAELYDRYYTLLDLRHPGEDGYEVRSLHNPFGNGQNVIFVGGSSQAGVEKAANALVARLTKARQDRSIRLGWLGEVELGKSYRVPRDVRDAETWEASAGYGSVGYFGWNSLSKRMALYYATGDPLHAREFLRLAFPDAKARAEIAEIDGERIEDKDRPLSGPYHYTAHLMILFWDLIEESPVFTDEERLRVTQGFADQLKHWAAEWSYAGRPSGPARFVGSRHDQWSAVALFCLARYFHTYYPNPVWKQNLEGAGWRFSSLHHHAAVVGETDNLFWYNTGVAPICTYLLLAGDRVPVENGVLGRLLRGQEILASGRSGDWALNSAALDFLHKAAYLTQDGRWLVYRDRTGVDVGKFRLGQSFWPEEERKPRPPDDLVNRWSIHRPAEPEWKARSSGLALGQSFLFGSFRSRTDAGGDFILLDGYNGASRNPYHAFAVLDLRLGGYNLLGGYWNQVLTRVDGLMEPKIAMDAALAQCDVLGATAFAVADVPDAAFARWRRTLLDRVGRWVVIADELTFRQESPNAEVSLEWQTHQPARQTGEGTVVFPAVKEVPAREIGRWGQIHACDPLPVTSAGVRTTMRWLGPVRAGGRQAFFSLVGIQPDGPKPTLGCYRLTSDSAALALPEPALVLAQPGGEFAAQLAVLEGDHVVGLAATRLGGLLEATAPVSVDWDFGTGTMHVVAEQAAEVRLSLDPSARPAVDGKPVVPRQRLEVALAPGRHVVEHAIPGPQLLAEHRRQLAAALEKGAGLRTEAIAGQARLAEKEAAASAPAEVRTLAQLASAVVDVAVVPAEEGPLVAAAEGSRIHLVGLEGGVKRTLAADGPIRMLRWWPGARLLLAGCADEKVIAFELSGRRRWVFVSEMDPAVLRAAKTYWFKSAPGHEGIHGLDVGPLVDPLVGGQEQVFVGSACTLEILDASGKLVRRMPLFWGKVSTFAVIDGPRGSKSLLAAFKYNGVNDVAIINGRTLDPNPRGFLGVPPGHTDVPGWSSMNRHHLFYEDLEGTGTADVVSEINGTWNRVCVWSGDGRPKYEANFGPGPGIDDRTMRDLDVADLNGDGRKEIVAATALGMVVLLDSRCNKLWAVRIPSPANVLACVRPKGGRQAEIVLGCDDGQLRVLDAKGNLMRRGKLPGRPGVVRRAAAPDGTTVVVMGTESGAVAGWRVE